MKCDSTWNALSVWWSEDLNPIYSPPPLSRTEVIVYVVERSPNGTSKRIAASTLYSYVEQANVKAQLAQLGVLMSVTRTELSQTQLKQLLQNAPAGQRDPPPCLSPFLCFCLSLNVCLSLSPSCLCYFRRTEYKV